MDALHGVGSALAAPGDYTRGLLAGTPGERVDPRGLLSSWGLADPDEGGFLAGLRDFGVGMLTDPLTYAGGLAGTKAAGNLFAKFGPRYGDNASKIGRLALPVGEDLPGGVQAFHEAMNSPARSAILHEIPEGSRFLGAGAESVNFRTPANDVVKVLQHNPRAATGIPEVEGVIQPSRRVLHGNYEVNRVPLARNVGDPELYSANAERLRETLGNRGIDVFDLKPEDLGLVGGKPTILDMGSIDPGTALPWKPITGQPTAPWLASGAMAGSSSPALLQALLGR